MPEYKDGRFIGSDGFIVPRNAGELYAEHPDCVIKMCHNLARRVGGYTREEMDELVADVWLHLLQLPEKTKFVDATDRVNTFDPVKTGGCTEGLFFNYIKRIVRNKFLQAHNIHARDAINVKGNSSIVDNVMDSEGEFVRSCISHEGLEVYMSRVGVQEVNDPDRMLFLSMFLEFLTEHEPELMPFAMKISETKNLMEVRRELNIELRSVYHLLTKLRKQARKFQKIDRIVNPKALIAKRKGGRPKGMSNSPETRLKIRNAQLGRKHSEETKQKMREAAAIRYGR